MKKGFTVILVIVTIGLVLVNVPFMTTLFTSNKLKCKSNEGNITLMYNDDTVTYFLTNDIYYDLDNQKAMIEKIGINDYIDNFSNWFTVNTSGKCVK